MDYKLVNIQPGYAEMWFWYGKKTDDDDCDEVGVIWQEQFVDHTDFEKDEVYKVKRWVAHSYFPPELVSKYTVGRKTGYRTRKEAIQALVDYWIKKKED